MEKGNFVDPLSGQKTGQNILYTQQGQEKTAAYEKIRSKLLAARNARPRPELDDKVLTDWNGLMIAALAKAAQVLDMPEYGTAAIDAAQFILHNLRSQEGKLMHRWRNGTAGLTATAADYAFMTWGLLELYGWDFDPKWLEHALGLTDDLLENYWYEKLGGFYLTPENKKSMLPRIKENIDNALPSSNSVSIINMIRLSRLTGNHIFAQKAAQVSLLFSSRVKDSPLAFPMLLASLGLILSPSREVVIVGKAEADDTKKMLRSLRKNYFPNVSVLFKPSGEQTPLINNYASFIEFMSAIDNKATAYVCTDFKCNFPTTDPAKMLDNLLSLSGKN
jgi:uncharacterized protein YyaL (SSP411 family)